VAYDGRRWHSRRAGRLPWVIARCSGVQPMSSLSFTVSALGPVRNAASCMQYRSLSRHEHVMDYFVCKVMWCISAAWCRRTMGSSSSSGVLRMASRRSRISVSPVAAASCSALREAKTNRVDSHAGSSGAIFTCRTVVRGRRRQGRETHRALVQASRLVVLAAGALLHVVFHCAC